MFLSRTKDKYSFQLAVASSLVSVPVNIKVGLDQIKYLAHDDTI